MSDGFGMESPRVHTHGALRQPARFVVVIDAGGSTVVRLFLASRARVAEFDAGAEEAAQMIAGLVPAQGAEGPEWDAALEGHSADERRAAQVYTLSV